MVFKTCNSSFQNIIFQNIEILSNFEFIRFLTPDTNFTLNVFYAFNLSFDNVIWASKIFDISLFRFDDPFILIFIYKTYFSNNIFGSKPKKKH